VVCDQNTCPRYATRCHANSTTYTDTYAHAYTNTNTYSDAYTGSCSDDHAISGASYNPSGWREHTASDQRHK
jgi:hypothetical protein